MHTAIHITDIGHIRATIDRANNTGAKKVEFEWTDKGIILTAKLPDNKGLNLYRSVLVPFTNFIAIEFDLETRADKNTVVDEKNSKQTASNV